MASSEVCSGMLAEDAAMPPAVGNACSVHNIFESVFEDAMSDFKDPLDYLKENKYRFAWKNDRERHEKTMDHGRRFVADVIQGFRSKHGDVAVAVEGSACEAFQKYFTEKMNADATENMLEISLREINSEFNRKITMVKESLEKEKGKQPKPKSGIEEVISKTELLDTIHIHHALICCRIAHECEDPEHLEKSLEKLNEKHLLSAFSVSYENKNVPKYLMARCGDVLYVTFRGLHFSKIGFSTSDWRGQVCSGKVTVIFSTFTEKCIV